MDVTVERLRILTVCVCGLIAIVLLFSVAIPNLMTERDDITLESRIPSTSNTISNIEQQVQELQASFFIENIGQLENKDVRFYQSSKDIGIGFAKNTILLTLIKRETSGTDRTPQMVEDNFKAMKQPISAKGILLEMVFEESNNVMPSGNVELSHLSNFFLGNDPSEWHTGVRSYSEIVYREIYNGIDVVYHGGPDGIKYDIIVQPGADLSEITIRYSGQESMAIDEMGNLEVKTTFGTLVDSLPLAYQGEGSEVYCSFVLRGPDKYGFECPDWNLMEPLVIDPLIYSTYLGGSYTDAGSSITVDSQGFTYVTGYTNSNNFPIHNPLPGLGTFQGIQDIFITKLSSTGDAIIFSTYLGGEGSDISNSITLDSSGNIYVAGRTESSDFPTAYPYQGSINGESDAFFTKLNPGCSQILASTYLGGRGTENAHEITVFQETYVYLVGTTKSGSGDNSFPTTSGGDPTQGDGTDIFGDGFLSKLYVPSGSSMQLVFSTYIGGGKYEEGSGIIGEDQAHNVEVDSSGRAYICGHIGSSWDFTATPGAADEVFYPEQYGIAEGFFIRINPDPEQSWEINKEYLTYLGGSDPDDIYGLSIRPGGTSGHLVYLTGTTFSDDFPIPASARSYDRTREPGYNDAVVILLDPAAQGQNDLLYSSYLGGALADTGNRVDLDDSNLFWITGWTKSEDFPTTPGAYDRSSNGGYDAFVVKMNLEIDGYYSLVYSTYLGGSADDLGVEIAVDSFHCPYVTGSTKGGGFPTTIGAYQESYGGGTTDAFVTELDVACFVPFTVSGHKVNDLDGDGIWDPGEPGIGGWAISLSRAGDPYTGVTWTASSGDIGYYSFTVSQAGIYTIEEYVVSDWTQTAPTPIPPGSYTFTAKNGQDQTNNDFLNFQHFVLSGAKVEDIDGDGIRDPGEPTIPDWTIDLYRNGVPYATTITGPGGTYSFIITEGGTYEVKEVLKPGWTQMAPVPIPPGSYTFIAQSGQNQEDKDFLNFQHGSICGSKFYDDNHNGLWDISEPAIAGWRIQLRLGGVLVGEEVTNALGGYCFNDLSYGQYEVSEVMPLDPDPYHVWGQTYPGNNGIWIIVMTSGANFVNIDFGNVCEYKYGKTWGWWKTHTGYEGPDYDTTYDSLMMWPLQVDIPIPPPAGDNDYLVENACEATYIFDGGGGPDYGNPCHGLGPQPNCDDQPGGKCLSLFRAQLLALHLNLLKYSGPIPAIGPCTAPEENQHMACQLYYPNLSPPDPYTGWKVLDIYNDMVPKLGTLQDYVALQNTLNQINNNGSRGPGEHVLVSPTRPIPRY